MVDGPDPETIADKFAVLSHPLRVNILMALAETRQPSLQQRGMSYSALRTALNESPGGRFNYHLGELQGKFVASEDGHYWLTGAGSRVVNEMYAGTFSGSAPTMSGPIDDECPHDGKQLTGRFEDGTFSISCPDHGVIFRKSLLFNVTTDRTMQELFVWATRRAYQDVEAAALDVCPSCTGRFGEPSFESVTVEDREWVESLGVEETVTVTVECQQCGMFKFAPAYYFGVIRTPARAFLYEHGIDVQSPAWDESPAEFDHDSRLLEDGVLIRFELAEEHLELELDSSLEVRSHRRLSPDGSE